MAKLEVKRKREEKGVTLWELASFLNSTEVYLADLENGKRRLDPAFEKEILDKLDKISLIKAKFYGKTLQELRKERHITVKDLVAASKVNRVTIAKIEKGRGIPRDDTIKKLLDALADIPVIDIKLSGTDLKQLREEKGLTQAELAKASGVSVSTIVLKRGKWKVVRIFWKDWFLV